MFNITRYVRLLDSYTILFIYGIEDNASSTQREQQAVVGLCIEMW